MNSGLGVRWCLLFALFLLAGRPAEAQRFRNPSHLPTVSDPQSVLAGDLTGDGVPDLIYMTAKSSGTVAHPLLADGKGNYIPGVSFTFPTLSPRCKLADVNSDGKLDLLCAAATHLASVGVLLGNGDGTFQAILTSTLPAGDPTYGTDLALADPVDLNGDGKLDLLVTDRQANAVYPMLGDGSGRFAVAPTIRNSDPVNAVAVADVNGDGLPDVLTQSDDTTLAVFLGNGDGTYTLSNQLGALTRALLVDMDGDGTLDLVGGRPGTLIVLHGNGDGTFRNSNMGSPLVSISYGDLSSNVNAAGSGSFLEPLACKDLNGDGILDIVAEGYDGFTVLLGKPGLQFAAPKHYPLGNANAVGLASTVPRLIDMNGDGHPDVVSVGPNGISLMYGQADGTFVSADVYESGYAVRSVTAADVNEDGNQDVITAGDRQLYINFGKSDGTFATPIALPYSLASGSLSQFNLFRSVFHGDVNGDGHQDLIVVGVPDGSTDTLYVLTGRGDGTFAAPVQVAVAGPMEVPIAVLDMDGDGRDDIVTRTVPGVTVYLSKTAGFRAVSSSLDISGGGSNAVDTAIRDLNGDGYPDLVFPRAGELAVVPGHGDGSFGEPVLFAMPAGVPNSDLSLVATAIGDFNGDGAPDLALLTQAPPDGDFLLPETLNQLVVFYHQGSLPQLDVNSFVAGDASPVTARSFGALYAADLDGDGRADVIAQGAVTSDALNDVAVFPGQDDRVLGPEEDYVAGVGLGSMAFADLNHDGRLDLISANNLTNGGSSVANAFTVLLSEGPAVASGTLAATPNPVGVGAPFTITATVRVGSGSAVQHGTVSFSVDGTSIGTAVVAKGAASLAGPQTLPVGLHTLEAVVSNLSTADDMTYASLHLSGRVTVQLAATTLALTASRNPAAPNQQVTFTVAVVNGTTAGSGAPQPGGTVSVSVDGKAVGSVTLAGASGSFVYPFPAAGSYNVQAVYSGDVGHVGSNASVMEVVKAAEVASDFSLGLSAPVVTIQPGQQGSVTVHLASLGEFKGTLTLAQQGLPIGLSASFSPAQVTLSTGGNSNAELVIATGQTSARASTADHVNPGGRRAKGIALAAFGCLLPLSFGGRRRVRVCAGLCAMTLACLGLQGCTDLGVPLLQPGTYHFAVEATDGATKTTHKANLQVVVGTQAATPVTGPH